MTPRTTLSRAVSRITAIWVTLAYASALAVVAALLAAQGPAVQDRVIRHASTNLHNLAHGRVGTLLGSAFVVDVGDMAFWLPGLICLLAVAELIWRSKRLVVAFLVGHIGATVLIAAALAVAVAMQWMPASVSRVTDVGMSYGATAVLGVLTAAIPARWRPTWACWWLVLGVAVVAASHDFTDAGHLVALVLGVAVVAASHDFTDAGHLVALVLGMLVSTRFGAPAPWTAPRLVLLAVGAAFGYLVIASSAPPQATLIALVAVAMIAGWRKSPMTSQKKP